MAKLLLTKNYYIVLADVAQLVGVLSHTLKDFKSDSQSGHDPRFRVQFPVGAHMGDTQIMSPSH